MDGADAEVAAYIGRWRPSSVSPQAAAFARDVIGQAAPEGRERAKNLLWAAGRLAGYAASLGLDLVPEVVFHPSVTERFARCAPGLPGVARRTLRTNQRFIARWVVPHLYPADVPLPRRSPDGSARAATTTTPSSARPTWDCKRSRSPSTSATRAAPPPRWTPAACPPNGAPGCSSRQPAPTPSAAKVAGYVAKYATKAAECTGTLDRRITTADRLDDLPVRDHARRHIAECLRLGKLPQLKELRLAAWAHMLGFCGHFSTKSRAYSITLGALRADRATHQREYAIAAGLQPDVDSDTTLVLTDWHYAGRGHPLIDLLAPMGGVPCPGS